MIADLQARKLKLIEHSRGALEIWAHPQEHMRYVIGIDTAGGGPQGDWAAAAVCETRTRDLVALWHTKRDPTEWGRMCANLGYYYNRAMLAFETHPSPHGLSACLSARDSGYPTIFRRRQESTVSHKITEELGWASTARTRGLMVDRVRVALRENYALPSKEILQELRHGKYKEGGAIEFDGHDDAYVAYAIAQIACDQAVQSGFLSGEGPEQYDWNREYWKRRNRELSGEPEPMDETMQAYDGS
jgi:hypothetical protein